MKIIIIFVLILINTFNLFSQSISVNYNLIENELDAAVSRIIELDHIDDSSIVFYSILDQNKKDNNLFSVSSSYFHIEPDTTVLANFDYLLNIKGYAVVIKMTNSFQRHFLIKNSLIRRIRNWHMFESNISYNYVVIGNIPAIISVYSDTGLINREIISNSCEIDVFKW